MTKKDIWVVYSTFGTREEALSVAQILLEKRLIACANLYDNTVSLYRWEGAIAKEQEVVMMAKTTGEQLQPAMDAIKSLHSYQLPCITAYPVAEGFPPFLQWVRDETA
jgi:periplasmic divalent cation tolerance protein